MNKLQFAKMVAWLTYRGMRELDVQELGELDAMVVPVPVPTVSSVPNIDICAFDYMLRLMFEGTRKIEAIKQCRILTGLGLKEAKDMVENYWQSKLDNS